MKDRLIAQLPQQTVHFWDAEAIFVADYTDQSANAKGLEASSTKPQDIESFVIENTARVGFLFAPFGANQLLDGNGKEIEHCECLFFPNNFEMESSWLFLLELKHAKVNRSGGHLQKAMHQLFATLDYFRENAVIPRDKTVHLIVSIPNRHKVPFENSILTPPQLKEIRRQRQAIVRGTNAVTIESNSRLKV